jgi:hypothetical protein
MLLSKSVPGTSDEDDFWLGFVLVGWLWVVFPPLTRSGRTSEPVRPHITQPSHATLVVARLDSYSGGL